MNLTLVNDNPEMGNVSGGGNLTTKTITFYNYLGTNMSTSTYLSAYIAEVPFTIKGAPTITYCLYANSSGLPASGVFAGMGLFANADDIYGKFILNVLYNTGTNKYNHAIGTNSAETNISLTTSTNNYIHTKITGSTSSTNVTVGAKLSTSASTPTSYTNYNAVLEKFSTSSTKSYILAYPAIYADGALSEPYVGWMGRAYPLKITDSTGTVLDLQPAKRSSDNKWGFYDKVSKNFYTNFGSRAFTQDSATATGDGAYGTTITATPLNGFMFMGWYDNNGNFLSDSASYQIAITEDTTIHAKFCSMCTILRR